MKLSVTLCATALLFAASPSFSDPEVCPPGLAKKAVACVPPGLGKNAIRFDGDTYQINGQTAYAIRNPGLWGLDDGGTYVRVGDTVYQVDRESRQVLRRIGATKRVRNR